MKQTAVEWLSKQISSSKYFYKLMEDINSRSTISQSDIIEQAKEMEKEQIINAYNISWALRDKPYATADKYYKETFKSE
jgi:hypothetical protein